MAQPSRSPKKSLYRRDREQAENELLGKVPIGKDIPGITATVLADMQSGLDEVQPRCRASKSIPTLMPHLQYREKPEKAGAEH
jgi:hypothetical protein